MTILQSLAAIPAMLYACIIGLPVLVFGYLTLAKPRKAVRIQNADPAEQLKPLQIDIKRELAKSVLFGSAIATSIGMLVFVFAVIADYRASTGIFAVELPAKTLPPFMESNLPPKPPAFAATSSDDGLQDGVNQQIRADGLE